ncbi:histidine kinase [Salinarimonas sp.]
MPTLFRLVFILAILAGLVYAGMWALALFVEPETREITTTVPPSRLAPR